MIKRRTATGIFCVTLYACSKSVSTTSTTSPKFAAPKKLSYECDANLYQYCVTSSGCHEAGSYDEPGAPVSYVLVYRTKSAIRTAVINGSMPENGSLFNKQKKPLCAG